MLYKNQVGYLKQQRGHLSIKIRGVSNMGIYSNYVKQIEIKQLIMRKNSLFKQGKNPSFIF